MRTLIRFGISGVVFLVFLLHVGGALPIPLLTQIENLSYDSRILMTLPRQRDPRVVIIDIDEKSLNAEGQWQWSRDLLARLVEQAFDHYGVQALGFDVTFPEPDRVSGGPLLERIAHEVPSLQPQLPELAARLDNDAAFARALRGRNVVLGMVFKEEAGARSPSKGVLGVPLLGPEDVERFPLNYYDRATGYTSNLPVLAEAAPRAGFFDNPMVDPDGVYRRVPLMQKFDGAVYGSLALELVRLSQGEPPVNFEFDPPEARNSLSIERVWVGPLSARVDEQLAVYVPFRGPPFSFPYVSATDVIRGTVPDPAVLRGAIALLGTTAPGLFDFRVTPVSNIYPGVEVHANIVSGFLDGRMKQKAPYYPGIEIVMMLVIGALVAWAFPRLSPLFSAGFALALLGAVVGVALLAWSRFNLIMPMGTPMVFVVALFLAHLLFGYFIESRGKRNVQKLFGQYVPPELVDEMAEEPDAVSMEGESREMTVLFSDVRGFTTISETLEARELSQMMNEFLTPLTGVIHRYRGTIDKYMGDAIMAFWGAPLRDPEHATHALQAGLAMTRVVRELDEPFEKRGWPKIKIGVGVNTGEMRVGNMGSEFRMAYTVMGDAVNLGSRLEGLTKSYGVEFICSETTRLAGPPDWAYRELDRVRVKGKKEPVTIFEPLGPKQELDPQLREDVARHRGALKAYRAQQWDVAEQAWAALHALRPHLLYEIYLARIRDLRAAPPGPDWDGVFTHTTK